MFRYIIIVRNGTEVEYKVRGDDLKHLKAMVRGVKGNGLDVIIEDRRKAKYIFYTLKNGRLFK